MAKPSRSRRSNFTTEATVRVHGADAAEALTKAPAFDVKAIAKAFRVPLYKLGIEGLGRAPKPRRPARRNR